MIVKSTWHPDKGVITFKPDKYRQKFPEPYILEIDEKQHITLVACDLSGSRIQLGRLPDEGYKLNHQDKWEVVFIKTINK